MREGARTFLFQLLEAIGPAGYEAPAARIWREEAATVAASVTTDINGNTLARLRNDPPPGARKVLLAGHIDEIGLVITHLKDDGTLAFRAIGGWDPQLLAGQRVRVATRSGTISGVIGRTPIHLTRGEARDKAVRLEDLWIDLGLTTKEETARLVRVGDPAVLDAPPIELAGGALASRALDNRISAFIVLETMRLLATGAPPRVDVYAAATVQEETTMRGAHTVAGLLQPDIAIALDVTHSSDRPGVTPEEVGQHGLGSGAAILRGGVANEALGDLLQRTAVAEALPYTVEALGGRSGTDADAMSLAGQGRAAAVVSVPCRYMHSPVEVVSLADVDVVTRLLAATIRSLEPEVDLRPR